MTTRRPKRIEPGDEVLVPRAFSAPCRAVVREVHGTPSFRFVLVTLLDEFSESDDDGPLTSVRYDDVERIEPSPKTRPA